MRLFHTALSAAGLCLAAAMPSSAAFVPVETFESRTPGDIGGQGGWLSSSATAALVEVDPAGPGNQVLHRVGTGGASVPLSLANATSGTFFLRVRNAGGGTTNNDEVYGLSDAVAAPDLGGDFGVFEVQSAVLNRTLRFRDAGAAQDKATLVDNTWYNIWMVVDNTVDTWRMYVQSNGDPAFLAQTELLSTSVDADIDFRNGVAANALTAFLAKAGGGGGTTSVFYDDLYLDTTGANLTNPSGNVPEPASVALLAVAGLAALGYRRR